MFAVMSRRKYLLCNLRRADI